MRKRGGGGKRTRKRYSGRSFSTKWEGERQKEVKEHGIERRSWNSEKKDTSYSDPYPKRLEKKEKGLVSGKTGGGEKFEGEEIFTPWEVFSWFEQEKQKGMEGYSQAAREKGRWGEGLGGDPPVQLRRRPFNDTKNRGEVVKGKLFPQKRIYRGGGALLSSREVEEEGWFLVGKRGTRAREGEPARYCSRLKKKKRKDWRCNWGENAQGVDASPVQEKPALKGKPRGEQGGVTEGGVIRWGKRFECIEEKE